jgi:LysM repeat protein
VSTSAPVPARTTSTTIPSIAYRVKRGDTLTKIASHFRVSVSAIVSANRIADPDRLTEGQTLRIPPAPPLKLVISPPDGQAGQALQLELTGSMRSETIKFEIDSAAGKYTGGPHSASPDGTVTATYQTAPADPTGIYNVTATGNLGTLVRAAFVVAPVTTANT